MLYGNLIDDKVFGQFKWKMGIIYEPDSMMLIERFDQLCNRLIIDCVSLL